MRPRRAVAVAVVAIAAVAAVGAAAAFALTRGGGAEAGQIVVSSSQCGRDWAPPRSGRTVFTVENTTPGTVYSVVLANAYQSRIFGQIETLEPSTELPLDVVLPPGEYAFVCSTRSGLSLVSPLREVRGGPVTDAHPYTPVSDQLMQSAAHDYNESLRPVMHSSCATPTGSTRRSRPGDWARPAGSGSRRTSTTRSSASPTTRSGASTTRSTSGRWDSPAACTTRSSAASCASSTGSGTGSRRRRSRRSPRRSTAPCTAW